jgi:hypothetical protein
MRRGNGRVLLAAAGLVLVLAGTAPGWAGVAVVRFPVFSSAVIFFVTSGFTTLPIGGLGSSLFSHVVIQPIIVVRPRVFVAPTRVVLLSPAVPTSLAILPPVPMDAPSIEPTFDPRLTAPPDTVTVDSVARAPELFEHRLVTVGGKVSHVGSFIDGSGQPYMFFLLQGDLRSVSVLVGGHADLHDGLSVRVTGVFYRSAVAPEGWPSGVIQALAVTGAP